MKQGIDSKIYRILAVVRPPGRAPATPPGGASRRATDAARPRAPRRLGSRPKMRLWGWVVCRPAPGCLQPFKTAAASSARESASWWIACPTCWLLQSAELSPACGARLVHGGHGLAGDDVIRDADCKQKFSGQACGRGERAKCRSATRGLRAAARIHLCFRYLHKTSPCNSERTATSTISTATTIFSSSGDRYSSKESKPKAKVRKRKLNLGP